MFYTWRFNRALKTLGFDPSSIPVLHRHAGLVTASARGDSPQEAALMLASIDRTASRRFRCQAAVHNWILRGNIDLQKDHVREAIDLLNDAGGL